MWACGRVGLRQAIAVTVRDVDGIEFAFSVNEIESVQALSLRSSVDVRSRWLSGCQVPHPQSGLPVPRLGALVFEASREPPLARRGRHQESQQVPRH